MKKNRGRTIIFTGVFAAMICVVTMIHIGSANGYIHVGDAMNYIATMILPFPFGMFAGGIGGALSDLFLGYPMYIIPTLLIKSLNSLTIYAIVKSRLKIVSVSAIVATSVSGIVTIIGYTFADMILYQAEFQTALIKTASGNIFQAVGSVVVFVIIGKMLDKTEITKRLN